MPNPTKNKSLIYYSLITTSFCITALSLSAKIALYPFRACRPCNDIAPLLTSQPNAQHVTTEHQVFFNLPASDNKKILFLQDQNPSFYLYQQQKEDQAGNRKSYTCIIGTINLSSYDDGSIKQHELTLADKACDLEVFIETQQAEFNPVLLIYDNQLTAAHDIKKIIDLYTHHLPVQSFISEDGIQHSLWPISSTRDITMLQKLFANIPTAYVADGHHRLAVAKNLRDKHAHTNTSHRFSYLLAAFASSDNATLADFNRIVKNSPLEPAQLIRMISQHFNITAVNIDSAKPTKLHTFGMYLDGSWYHLTAQPDLYKNTNHDPRSTLDIFLINHYILEPLLAYKNTDTKLEYVGGINNLRELETKCTSAHDIAFAIYPVPMDQFMAVVDAGQLMPPKSTWFEPKLPPGLVAYTFQQ